MKDIRGQELSVGDFVIAFLFDQGKGMELNLLYQENSINYWRNYHSGGCLFEYIESGDFFILGNMIEDIELLSAYLRYYQSFEIDDLF